MKTVIEHRLYGTISYDSGTGSVKVQHSDLEERLTWLLKTKNAHLLGHGYFPNRFLRACDVLGILEGASEVKTDAKDPADGGPE